MLAPSLSFSIDTGFYDQTIGDLHARVFGPGRFARAAFKVREGVAHDRQLSFAAVEGGVLIGSVIQTRIRVGDHLGSLLGPLAVLPDYEGRGIGRNLVDLATKATQDAGLDFVLLVGDRAYYQPLGFHPTTLQAVGFPAPVDPARILACCFGDLTARSLSGVVEALQP